MHIIILTIFPELFTSFLGASLIGKARQSGKLTVTCENIRDYASPPHYHVDDMPYGGGAGMVMKPEPLAAAIEAARGRIPGAPVILLSPAGEVFTQTTALELSRVPGLILVCGRYEGVDQRVIDLLVDREVSIGDYVLMGGEVGAMVVIEATARLIPEVVGNSESILHESFSAGDGTGPLEAPHYTRPPEFRGHRVPDTLLSGNHARIAEWRKEQSTARTAARRPDLVKKR